MIAETYNTALSLAAKIINEIKNNFTNYYTDNSLVEATKMTRVEPLVVISKDCLSLDITKDVLDVKLNMFSAYYLQAVSILTKVNNVEVIKVLDKLNPDRDGTGFLLSNEYAAEAAALHLAENYKYRLPSMESYALEMLNATSTSKMHESQKAVDTINELTSMATGRLLNVEIVVPCEDNTPRVVTIPVSVRLMPSMVSGSTVSHLLAYQSEDTSMFERFHKWRAGRINFISDLIFCQDLLDEYKRASMGDNSGTMAEIARRVQNAKKYGLLTKNPSLAAASNLFIMSKTVAKDVEARLRGTLSNFKTREKAFQNTYAMIIAVIDPEVDRVTFYTRGQQAAADFSFREIKAAGKGSKGPDIMDIMKAMQQSAPISF